MGSPGENILQFLLNDFFDRRGKTKGLFVMSFPTYAQKENLFSLYTSFINPRINVNVHTQSELSFVSTP